MGLLRVLVSLGAVLVMSGCAAAQQAETSSQPSSDSESTEDAEAADSGQMVVTYQDATTPEARNGREILQNAKALEAYADEVNTSFVLPYDIPLLGVQCDDPNAFWNRSEQSLTICYEDVDLAEAIFIEAGDPDPVASALNTEAGTFFHELGHMVTDIYELPVLGRQEDAADQLAAVILLEPNGNGDVDPESITTVYDFAREFDAYAAMRGELSETNYANEHSLDQTRMYNLLCWAYGADPETAAVIVDNGDLPENRAAGCPEEYAKIRNAWVTLLTPYAKN